MKKMLLILFISIAVKTVLGQGYYNKWYFGYNAGLDFNTNPPTPITGTLFTHDGCATICDYDGNLLFYTDGTRVWNKNHKQMPNGMNLKGQGASTQSALIVPNPGNMNQYYILTTTNRSMPYHYSTYSIIDMTLDQGLGDVTLIKNIILHPESTERLTAVPFADKLGYWIIGIDNIYPEFFAYRLTNNGFDSFPVISKFSGCNLGKVGYLKASHSGNRLALAKYFHDSVMVFNFDNNTGIISNPISISITPPFSAFGTEFSSDDSKLYFNVMYFGRSEIYQINLKAGTQDSIKASKTLIKYSENEWGGALQLAPDGKIYVAQESKFYLGVINNPDSLGLKCNYVNNQVSLKKASTFGLPNFFEMTFCTHQTIHTRKDTTLCKGDTLTINLSSIDGVCQWQDGSTNPLYQITQAGVYWVKVTTPCEILTDTIVVKFTAYPEVNLGNDTILCYRKSIVLNATNDYATYLWQDNSTKATYTVTDSGTYWVTVSNKCGKASDTINIDYITCDCFVYLPNAFTPNTDGLNDQFIPISNCLFTDFRFKIFNRWGEQIFESSDPALGWDGKYKGETVPLGTYYYYIIYQFENTSKKDAFGNVVVIR